MVLGHLTQECRVSYGVASMASGSEITPCNKDINHYSNALAFVTRLLIG